MIAWQVGSELHILNEKSGALRKFKNVTDAGGINRIGPDGCIYTNTHWQGIRRFDPEGNLKPFENTDVATGPYRGGLPNKAGSSGTTAWERDFYIDKDNNIYAKIRGSAYHGLMHVSVFLPK